VCVALPLKKGAAPSAPPIAYGSVGSDAALSGEAE
jgi:hypothetical protein